MGSYNAEHKTHNGT